MITRLNNLLIKAEKGFMTLLFFALLAVSALQIILRNLFESGLMWGDDFIQVSVLWIGFVGATFAARKGRHINIDVISRFLPRKLSKVLYRLVYFMTANLCAVAAYFCWQFVQLEMEDSVMAFLNVPVWATEIIIPIAFAVIALRYFLLFLKPTLALQYSQSQSQSQPTDLS